MKIYLVQATHWCVPGNPMHVSATRDLANIECARLVNIMLRDLELPQNADATNWENRLKIVHEKRCAELGMEGMSDWDATEDCDVWLTEMEVEEVLAKKDADQAFPHGDPTHGGELGMTLRDYFAAKAMQAIFAGPGARMVADRDGRYDETNWAEIVASNAYSMADAMLRERAVNNSP